MSEYLANNWIELVGYLGSVLVAASLSMKSISRLRQLNLIGAATFALYGLLVHAYPVFLLNGFIALMDVYYLLQMRSQKDYFELLRVNTAQSPFLHRFIDFYHDDINRFFPQFKLNEDGNALVVFVLRNMLPVSLFIAQKIDDATWQVCLDYAIPQYRDLQNAHYLYHKEGELFADLKIRRLITKTAVPAHRNYLEKMGFKDDPGRGADWYSKTL